MPISGFGRPPDGLQARLVEQGGIPSPGTAEAFRTLILGDWQKFAQIIKDVGIPLEG